ncbi:7006_t:CDS:2 [Paraglomus brasilianum]|uniref:7006_t:CDS:1 n=1 Tax=Paraglomus brasilianum TaxID=144538 RepID=A0A9N8VTD4_9GLOM|nr:7006_t:CDS:2 [Paraglomus brasilianum]
MSVTICKFSSTPPRKKTLSAVADVVQRWGLATNGNWELGRAFLAKKNSLGKRA